MSIFVKAGPNDSTDKLIRKFQKKVLEEKVVQEIREREFHRKPSELRKEFLAERRRKIKRYLRSM
ncbi:MAG: 30S ribosomal protein S21 [Candidatus Daviesbacteria bacterium]|nr:MAG: 30S ribosomal protein S21 [Candidatus Daviesbacteria bacterium]